MVPQNLARRVVAAARKFQQRQHWQELGNEDVIAFELPDHPHVVLASILGEAGKEFGMSLLLGDRAIDQMRELVVNRRPAILTTMAVMTFDPPGSVPPERRAVATAAGVSDRIIPIWFAVDPGSHARDARNSELRLFATVLDAIALADSRGLLRTRRFEPRRACKILNLRVTGGGRELDVVASMREVPAAADAPGIDLPWPIPDLPLLDEHWLIGLEPSLVRVENDGPLFLLALFDATSGLALDVAPVPAVGEDMTEAAQLLAQLLAHPRSGAEGGVPRRLTFVHQRLHDALAPQLAAMGIQVELVDEHPHLTSFLDAYRKRAASVDTDSIPDADDVEGWRLVHSSVLQRAERHRAFTGSDSRKAIAMFFGDADALADLEEEHMHVPRQLYERWFLVAYRGTDGRRTLAERLLGEPLPAAERLLLEAEIRARTGIYRVTAIEASLVRLADVLSDHVTDVIDGALAATARLGCFLPCRIGNAKGHRFMVSVGPMLTQTQLDRALADLETDGHRLDTDSLQADWTPLGHLWPWVLWDEPGELSLTNTDGEPTRLQTATFRVEDAANLRRALLARDDVAGDGDDQWIWERNDKRGSTVLAVLELLGDELLVEVNSDERLAAARTWLEAIPGVSFVHSVPDAAGGPAAERSGAIDPADLPPEVMRQVQAELDRRTLAWADERVRALGNQTPREAVRTPQGRERVLRLLRSWSDPAGVPELRVPLAALRSELGLPAEGEADQP